MNNSIQNEAEAQEQIRELPFRSAPEAETNEGTNTLISDPDRTVSIVVLVIACFGLAILAHVVV